MGRLLAARKSSVDVKLVALAVLMTLALCYWLWFGLTLRNINNDDGVSVLAAQGVLEHGYQLFPSGYSYNRGFLPHYLIAGSIGVFGLNNFSIMLPSLILGLGSLFLVYRIAKDILGWPWLGVVAVALLVSLSAQTWYATGPRMYMTFQFFTVLSMYGAWRGYVQDDGKFKFMTVLALAAAMLSHREGVILAVAIPATVLLVMRLRGQTWSSIFSLVNIASLFFLGLLVILVVNFSLPNGTPLIIGHGGVEPDRIGLNLNPVNWGRHVLHLERSIPFSLAFILVAYFAAFMSLRWRHASRYSLLYLFLVFTISFLIFGTIVRTGGSRLFFFLLPVYALLVCSGGLALIRYIFPGTEGRIRMGRPSKIVLVSMLVVGVVTSVGLSTLKQIPFDAVRDGAQPLSQFVAQALSQGLSITGLLEQGYGLPCSWGRGCRPDLKEQYGELAILIGPQDLVLSFAPFETSYFLGRMDGWMFSRREGKDYPALDRSPTDEYFGVLIIDTTEELRGFLDSEQRVWVIFGGGGAEGDFDLLDKEYTKSYQGTLLTGYTNFQ